MIVETLEVLCRDAARVNDAGEEPNDGATPFHHESVTSHQPLGLEVVARLVIGGLDVASDDGRGQFERGERIAVGWRDGSVGEARPTGEQVRRRKPGDAVDERAAERPAAAVVALQIGYADVRFGETICDDRERAGPGGDGGHAYLDKSRVVGREVREERFERRGPIAPNLLHLEAHRLAHRRGGHFGRHRRVSHAHGLPAGGPQPFAPTVASA